LPAAAVALAVVSTAAQWARGADSLGAAPPAVLTAPTAATPAANPMLAAPQPAAPLVAPIAGPPDGTQGPGFVQLAVGANDEDASALVETLRELVGRMGLGVQVVRAEASPWSGPDAPPVAPSERARIWVDESRPDQVTIVVSSARPGSVSAPLARIVPRGETRAITTEEVGHVIHATLESFLASEGPPPESTVPKVEPTAVVQGPPAVEATPQPVAPSPAGGFGLDVAGFATARQWGTNSNADFGGGGAVALSAGQGRWRPGLWISGAYSGAFDSQNTEVTLQTSATSLRAIPRVEIAALRVLQVDVGAGAGMDVFHTVPRDPGALVMLGSTRTVVDPVLTGQVVARIRVASSARLLVGVDVDYDFARHRYTALDAAGNRTAVLEPWALRPSAMIGLCLPLLGAVACGGRE
jgi:hypothetical protein